MRSVQLFFSVAPQLCFAFSGLPSLPSSSLTHLPCSLAFVLHGHCSQRQPFLSARPRPKAASAFPSMLFHSIPPFHAAGEHLGILSSSVFERSGCEGSQRRIALKRLAVRMFAAPRKKLPTRSVDVICCKCRSVLFKYKKGGTGSLVKCFVERIVQDFTAGDLTCPGCGSVFAREAMIRGRPAYKIIGGKATQK